MVDFTSTADVPVPEQIVDQVIGQDEAVEIIKKAAHQRRHVLLIGEPGTGKSMLGLALAQLLPKSTLTDIITLPNPNDENTPLVKEVPAGQGRAIARRAQTQSSKLFKNQNIIILGLIIFSTLLPYYFWKTGSISDIIYASSMITGIIFIVGFLLFLNLGARSMANKIETPKLIVDNYDKKNAPFYDATGAHAGALLGDVLHDPFQSFFTGQWLQLVGETKVEKKKINEQVDTLMEKHKNKVSNKKTGNYEAIHLPKDELFVLGETNGSVSPVEVLSSNRYDYAGDMIKLTTSENKELIVTPEHKVAVLKKGKVVYTEAKDIHQGDCVVSKKEELIDEQDIINSYNERQQEQCRLYYQYLDIKSRNPTWGYKRIAKAMGQKIGKTRWWHAGKHIPVPIQTAHWLRKRGLLPLKIDNPNLPLIAKVLGAIFGDGGIFENLNGIFLSSSEIEATEEFGQDLVRIFGEEIEDNKRTIEAGIEGHSWCYQNTNRKIIRLFVALGAPTGKKVEQKLIVPKWIKLHPTFGHEFYGSLLGSELGTPIIQKHCNSLTTLEVGITGRPHLEENRLAFLNELANYLKQNRVNTTSIYQSKTKMDSLVFRLLIEKKMDNVLLFLINVKINYCTYKTDRLYTALGKWSVLKMKKYYELLDRGYGAEHAMKTLNLTPNSLYLLLNHFGPNGEAQT